MVFGDGGSEEKVYCQQDATMAQETLLNVLEDLTEEEFDKFKFYLKDPGVMGGFNPVKNYRLETRERTVVVDLMVKAYKDQGAVEVTKKILEKIPRNDILQKLSAEQHSRWVLLRFWCLREPISRPEAQNHKIAASEDFTGSTGVMSSVLRPSNQEGCDEKADEQRLDDVYTQLYVTTGGDIHINAQHEVTQIDMVGNPSDTEQPISPSDLFTPPAGKYKPIRTVLTSGNAGVGKTFLIRKFVLDWAEQRANQDVHLILPFTFRQLNLLRGTRRSLAELTHKCIQESRAIQIEALNSIFTALQSSGDANFDNCKFKLLFILDGLDESRLEMDTRTNEFQEADIDVKAPCSVEKEEYFRRKFKEEEQACRIISHIKASRSLHIMCHIPIFCWVTAKVFEDVLKMREELPKTLTAMYISFLDLAFEQLQKGNVIFYESDLRDCGITVREADAYSGVFTQMFRRERGLFKEEADFYQCARALQNEKGHLDLFLRFLLGLSLPTNQALLRGLINGEGSSEPNQEIIGYIKEGDWRESSTCSTV
ncbi:NACHT, LRR and PYD domains-containing protein 3 [Takifugu flavidus]|uniref:NACHT, LRR and PYD domains-containing protein 3 n=1 Tax=Takifugu flavidus TaxID=433684 RepID=A0A5C6MFS2_9TELE|nr:NACHT, LRR and PYD domains-containing protein 3 [Takifugu flavidus]